jgi:DNA-binding transcriptional ArsR family regulator
MDRSGSGDANIAVVASLLADPARATILIALSDGRALPAGELARLAHIAPSTASSHLSKLVEGGLIEVESWGRHRYYRVAGPEIVGVIEALSIVSPAKPVRSLRQSREAEAVRFARTCYDHLAGFLGVGFTQALVKRGTLTESEDGYEVTLVYRLVYECTAHPRASSIQPLRTPGACSPHTLWRRAPHALTNGISTVAPSIRACAIANGTNRRSRRYKSVWKTEFGTDANNRYAMNFASKVNGMKACCMDQANATTAIATLVLRQRTWKRGSR